jgi:hypothetical protein
LASANTQNNFSLSYDYNKFSIQLSGNSNILKIKNYAFSGTYLYIETHGFVKENSNIDTFSDPIYIRPTKERMYEYYNSISILETQLIKDGIFLVPSIDIAKDSSFEQTFVWPKSIDGFAPDSFGTNFESYKVKILNAAEKIDQEKTDIFIKTVIPENYLELDSDGEIYRTIIQTYAYEFDKLKNYIDAIAYAHSVNYNDDESVPKKFLTKLSTLLGWELSESFSELNLFDYLTSDLDQQSNSFSYFNVEIWKRMLVNIVWLYKRKGTRDAIMFMFKLLGAPENLINFNEFVYDITQNIPNLTNKIDSDGYINYNSSAYAFQEGGKNRGNGDAYITQWTPEYNPTARIDNNKIEIGGETNGTRSIVNTKEIELSFSPSKAIEDDVWTYFKQSGTCWSWSSSSPAFSCLTIPFENLTYSCDVVSSVNISSMTLNQYIDYIYTNSIDPTNRKTNSQCHKTWSYPELKNIYLSYYKSTCSENNHLTFCKLESYLQLLEVQLGSYILQLVPSTSIFDGSVSTLYKNPVFHRQRFVYREGVDAGSVFRRELQEEIKPKIKYASTNKAKICIFAGRNISDNNIDITGDSWRVERNIPPQNICPSSKNVINKITVKNNDIIIPQLKKLEIKINYITNRILRIKPIKITCNVNKNHTEIGFGAVNIHSTHIEGTTLSELTEERTINY